MKDFRKVCEIRKETLTFLFLIALYFFSILVIQNIIRMKQKFLKIVLILVVFTAVSCIGDDVDIQSDRRLLVKGRIIDEKGTPLRNISVVTSALGDALGRTNTDANGNFSLVSLDEQFDPLDIFINANDFYNPNINENFGSFRYLSSEHTNRVLYDLGTIVLSEKAALNFNLNNIPGDNNILIYELKFTPADCQLPLNIIDPPIDCTLSENISGNLSPNSESQTFDVPSILGSTVIFEYSLNSGPNETIEILLNNEQNTFTFEY